MINRLTPVSAAISAIVLMSSPVAAYEFTFKGLVKTEILHSDAGVASFVGGKYSHVSPTHALRTDDTDPQVATYLDSASTSFQAAQSRFSLNMKHDKARAVFEMDFVDDDDGFTNQTALQAQGTRLRLATIYYDASDNVTVFAGQKWSTASGIKSSGSYNWVGNGYGAGNTGFLAMEAGATYKKDNLEVTGALTGKGRNLSSSGINANELGSMPGIAFDVNYSFDGHKVGVAGHFAEINYEDEPTFTTGENQDANLYKVYGTFKFGDLSLAAEAYTGESVNNQNALGLAPGSSAAGSFSESGFFTYLTWNIKPGHTAKFGYGTAEVDSGDQDRLTAASRAKNSSFYANYGCQVTKGLTAFAQITNFDTEYADSESFSATVLRVGSIFKF